MYSSSCPQASINACRTSRARPRPRNSSRVKTPSTSCPSGCSLTPAQRQAIRPVDEGAENAVFSGVGLLLVVVVPDLFLKGERRNGKFAG